MLVPPAPVFWIVALELTQIVPGVIEKLAVGIELYVIAGELAQDCAQAFSATT